MRMAFDRHNDAVRSRMKTLTTAVLACGIIGLTSTSGLAENRDFDNHKRNGQTLVSLYQQWTVDSQEKITIIPTSSKVSKAAKTISHSARKPQAESITDEEILALDEASTNDPFEPLNRLIFGVNEVLDMVVLSPISHTYRAIVPGPVRTGISGVIANIKSPVTFANDLLQGNPERAKTTLMRFLINSTAGFGGFVDAAEAGGFEKHTEDFGQTLAVWGVGSGPYLVAPVFGPMTPRHLVGRVVDTAATPTTWILADLSLLERASPTIADLVTGHEAIIDDVKTLRETSPDFYASVRGIYRQSRKSAVFNGDIEVDPIPDLPVE